MEGNNDICIDINTDFVVEHGLDTENIDTCAY